ncbi:MAG: lipopolysaccharide heptosyltransferase family protein [Planctomycetota bacterium]|nr:lipopolysaccharide heptosyltransferase family protein [Planctomycetota bacterium]
MPAIAAVDCADFNGYKPCRPGWLCGGCPHRKPVGRRVLLINLGALGNVIQTTAVLPAIRRAWPDSSVWFVTEPGNLPALARNPFVHRAVPFEWTEVMVLERMSFHAVLNADKARAACALAMRVEAAERRGFGLDRNGAVVPLNSEAAALYRIGLDDAFKFRTNRKSGAQLICEAFGLKYEGDEYILTLSEEEEAFVAEYRRRVGTAGRFAVGINTGCGDLFPNKKLTVEQHAELVVRLRAAMPDAAALLLGGRAETERNARIAALARARGADTIETPTTEGLRRGILYLAACDCVVTGDTSALHMAVALKKWCVAWFGLSCAAEVDLFGRGRKVISNLSCSPCWRKSCNFLAGDLVECVARTDLDAIAAGVVEGRSAWEKGFPPGRPAV